MRIFWKLHLSALLSQHRWLPLFALSGQGLVINLFLAPFADSLVKSSTTNSMTYQLSDVQAKCSMCTIDDSKIALMNSFWQVPRSEFLSKRSSLSITTSPAARPTILMWRSVELTHDLQVSGDLCPRAGGRWHEDAGEHVLLSLGCSDKGEIVMVPPVGDTPYPRPG